MLQESDTPRIAGVGLGGQGWGVGHSGAEEGRRVVHIDLETIHIALIQVVYLGIEIVDSRGGDRDSPVFQLKSVPQSELLRPSGHLPVAEYRACELMGISPASSFNVNCTLRVPCTSPASQPGSQATTSRPDCSSIPGSSTTPPSQIRPAPHCRWTPRFHWLCRLLLLAAGLVASTQHVHVELESWGASGAVGRRGGGGRHLVGLLHLILILVGYLGPVCPVVD